MGLSPLYASALFLEHDTPVAVQGQFKLSHTRQSDESLRKIVGRFENLQIINKAKCLINVSKVFDCYRTIIYVVNDDTANTIFIR